MRLPTSFNLKAEAFYILDYKDFSMRTHAHNGLEIMCAVKGGAEIETDVKRSIKRGQLIFIAPGASHKLRVADSCKMLNVEISFINSDFDLAPALKGTEEFFSAIDPVLIIDDTENITPRLRRLIAELSSGETSAAQLIAAETLIMSSRAYKSQSLSASPAISLALSYIADNFDSGISVDDVAAFARLNPSYLQRRFKDETGTTIVSYITNLRIDKAKKLMASTNLPLTDISAECGYNSRQNFYAAFKSLTGLSPKDYRDRLERAAAARYIQTPYFPDNQTD